jgi:hypothetical protein
MTLPVQYSPYPSHIKFRSALEEKVAQELDRLEVEWAYERQVVLPDGSSPYYLPDFTILDVPSDGINLQLPRWVEVKPMQFLYDVRDLSGVTRRCGDKFTYDVRVQGVDSAVLRGWSSELWKQKMLAEVTGEPVLVVGCVGAMSSLSILCTDRELVMSRQHPFVNQVGVERERQRAERDAERQVEQRKWHLHREQLQRQAEQRRLEQEQADATYRRQLMAYIRRQPTSRRNSYDQACGNCATIVPASHGWLYSVPLTTGARWVVICGACLE